MTKCAVLIDGIEFKTLSKMCGKIVGKGGVYFDENHGIEFIRVSVRSNLCNWKTL